MGVQLKSLITKLRRSAPPPISPHLELGQHGEALAAVYLEQQGYCLVAANFAVPVGRNLRGRLINAELDLVAYDGEILCFVEVKTRASDWFAPPEANVDVRKQRQISRAARAYRRLFGLVGVRWRYDVLTVLMPAADDPERKVPKLELLKSFWTDEKFRKRRWVDSSFDY